MCLHQKACMYNTKTWLWLGWHMFKESSHWAGLWCQNFFCFKEALFGEWVQVSGAAYRLTPVMLIPLINRDGFADRDPGNRGVNWRELFSFLQKCCPELNLLIYERQSKFSPDFLFEADVCFSLIVCIPSFKICFFSFPLVPLFSIPISFLLSPICRYRWVWRKPRHLWRGPVYKHTRDLSVSVLWWLHVIRGYEDLPG